MYLKTMLRIARGYDDLGALAAPWQAFRFRNRLKLRHSWN
jgi:hypothetical protein